MTDVQAWPAADYLTEPYFEAGCDWRDVAVERDPAYSAAINWADSINGGNYLLIQLVADGNQVRLVAQGQTVGYLEAGPGRTLAARLAKGDGWMYGKARPVRRGEPDAYLHEVQIPKGKP